jgi:hypothetical protein
MSKKKGIFFTVDAILAASVLLVLILLVSKYYISEPDKTQASFFSQDLVKVFTNMKVIDLDNDYVKGLIANGVITKTNNTILEQIGEFWAENELELAENFTRNVTGSLIPDNFGIGVYVFEEGPSIDAEEIYLRDKEITRNLVSSRKIISGIAKDKPTEGFTSKVILTGIKSRTTSAYVFFGGYEGDGNLTKKIILPKKVESILNVTLEADIGGDFNLYINNIFSGSYAKGSAGGGNMLADTFAIDEAYYGNFKNETNYITINFTKPSPFIAGGFLSVKYTTSEMNDTNSEGSKTEWMPGIDGLINYYSSFYVPGTLTNMQVHLDFFSNYPTFFKIGNTTVYSNTTNGSTTINLNNSALSNTLRLNGVNYSDLSLKTIPIRLGLNLSNVVEGNADIILITDVSGSMDWRLDNTNPGTSRNCNDPSLYSSSTKRISLAKCLNNNFINSILNTSKGNTTNRVGLVAYSGIPNNMRTASSTIVIATHNLSSNNVSLKNEINTYTPNGATGVCGAIRQARVMLESQSNSSRRKFIVLMTDGLANIQCSPSNQYQTSGCIADDCASSNNFCFGGNQTGCLYSQCGDWVDATASNNSIEAACRAFNTTNATVFSIGFGPVGNCQFGNQTLLNISTCGHGTYYTSSQAGQLSSIYNEIARRILTSSQTTQTINITGGKINTSLLPTSYIILNYTPVSNFSFGKIPLIFETERFGNNITTGTLTIPENTTVFDAKVTSYSSDKWTDRLTVNGNMVYDLSKYNLNYTLLGDPYTVDIPISNLGAGVNNLMIRTGISPANSTGGSADDRAIYTLLVKAVTDFSPVVRWSEGCNWVIGFSDNTTSMIKIPYDYSGNETCYYKNSTYNQDDAMNIAAYTLFANLDVDGDRLCDIKLSAEDFDIETLTISNVPSLWGPAIVEVRVWE